MKMNFRGEYKIWARGANPHVRSGISSGEKLVKWKRRKLLQLQLKTGMGGRGALFLLGVGPPCIPWITWILPTSFSIILAAHIGVWESVK